MLQNHTAAISFLLTMLLLAGCTSDEPVPKHFPSDETIQALIQSRVDENRAVGIVVGVMESDGSMRIFSTGTAGPDSQPLGERSIFEIGSITKVFTGILLADMAQKGEVALDDPVAKFLPESEVSMPTKGGKDITLLDLATHRSALPRMPDNFNPADPANPYIDYTIEQMYEFLSNHELQRDIGAQAEYSNLGVGLLGHVLARVNESSYEELVRERILDPLGMNNTAIELNNDMYNWLAKGHNLEGNVVPNWDIATFEGAGALRSDVQDMLTFILANTGTMETTLVEAIGISHQKKNNFGGNVDIGLNWLIQNVGNNKIIWHNGATGGYNAFAGFDPDIGVGAVVLANSSHNMNDIGFHLINSNLPLRSPPAERKEIGVPAEVLEKYAGSYQLAPNFVITITVNNGTIWAQATGQEKLHIYPESETAFFYKAVDAQITFESENSGAVTGLVLHQNGASMPAPKQ